MESLRIIVVILIIGGFVGTSLSKSLFGVCDFESSDICDLTGDHDFRVKHGRPSWDWQAMHSGYKGSGYILLRSYNSDNTISTPLLTHSDGIVEVRFAYYIDGNFGSNSFLRMSLQVSGGDLIEQWLETRHHNNWKYVSVSIDVPAGQDFQIHWTANAHKNTWTQQHDWLGLDYIDVQETGGTAASCFQPPPVHYANAWNCTSSLDHKSIRLTPREPFPEGTICTTSCLEGFAMQGQPLLTCNDGNWEDHGEDVLNCVDVQGPQFNTCPSDLEVKTPFGWGSMWYTISQPDISDNTDAWNLELYVNDEQQAGTNPTLELSVGVYSVLFVATDFYMNQNTCTYNITVKTSDEEAPRVKQCPASRTLQSDIPVTVTWLEPVFVDNTGYIDRVESNYGSGALMFVGIHNVVYTAYDNSSNSASCSFDIIVRGYPCTPLNLPNYGALACHDSYAGSFCVSMCGQEYDFELPLQEELIVPEDYLCSISGNWYPYEYTYNCLAPYGSETVMPSNYYFKGFCNETETQDMIRNQALAIYNDSDADTTLGSNLTAKDFYVRCGLHEHVYGLAEDYYRIQ